MAVDPTIQNKVLDLVDGLNAQATKAISDLTDYAGSHLYVNGAIDDPKFNGLPDPPADPDFSKFQDTRLYEPSDFGTWPTLASINDLNLDELFVSATPSRSQVWVDSSCLDTIQARLLRIAENGDVGWLTDAYQTNLFNRDRDRQLQKLNDSMTMLAAKNSARSFRLPTSMLNASQATLLQEFQWAGTAQSREIVTTTEKAVRDFIQMGIDAGIKNEQIEMGFTESYNQVILEAVKTRVSVYAANVDKAIRKFEADMRGIIARFEAEKASWDLTNAYNQMILEKEMAPWKVYELQVKAFSANVAQQVEKYKTQVLADAESLQMAGKVAVEAMKSLGANTINVNSTKG